MKATYGTYDHDDRDVLITGLQDSTEKSRGVVSRVKRTIGVMWEVRGTSQAELTTKILSAEIAYHSHGQNFVLSQDDGNDSAHVLRAGGTTIDITVLDFGFRSGEGIEYATKRTCFATLEGSIDFTGTPGGGGNDIFEYQDSITAIGNGGPRVAFRELPIGGFVTHTIYQETVRRLRQSGFSRSRTGFIFPMLVDAGTLLNPSVAETKIGPVWENGQYNYSTSWNYSFAGGNYVGSVPTFQ